MNRNFSKQRQRILNIIKTMCKDQKHLTVSDIFEEAQKEISNISLATVYRNLHILEDSQEIQRLQLGKNQVYYEPFTGPHHHFVCSKCNKIEHISDPSFKLCLSCIETKNKIHVEKVTTTIFGTCC